MTDISYLKTIVVSDRLTHVREISVGEIRAWLKDLELRANKVETALYSVDRDLFTELALDDLPRFCDLSPADIDALRPSDLRRLMDLVAEVNPDFFAMRRRMVTAADQVMALLQASAPSSSALSASPSSAGITPPGATG